MVNCSFQGEELKMSDHMLHAWKLRPLMPQPTAISRNTMRSSILEPLYCCIPNSTFCAWSYHLTNASVKRELNVEPLVSPRWNPTPEQIQALQEMYRHGLRTPTAEQIQQIAAKLRQFGKIEGKNVFYWFQNHKARERQKWRRRQLGSPPEKKLRHVETLDRKESEHSRKDVEVEQAKNSNCSTISEDSVSKHRAVMAESRTNGWAQFDERELQKTRQSKRVKKAIPQMDLFPCQSSNYLLNTITTSITSESNITYSNFSNDDYSKLGNENGENQTLQLFPLGIANAIRAAEKENEMLTTNMTTSCSPKQFIEFL